MSQRLHQNLKDLDKPALLTNPDLIEYVKAFFHHAVNKELQQHRYKDTDNQFLNAVWQLIPKFISNDICRDFWRTEYLYDHIDNSGIKNIGAIMQNYRALSKNMSAKDRVEKAYAEDSVGREGHLIQSYKFVNGVSLDLHMFMPDTTKFTGKRPVYVYFHGGSWSEGKADWGFSTCEAYAQKGWVGVAVEYRTVNRNNTLPFSAVMDARSVIRWIRKNAALYHIDTAKVVATGNSAGGHLVLATALASKWNEKKDDLSVNPTPNVLLVNSGVYDLTVDNTKWITKGLKNKEQVKEISPNHLDKTNMPPLLVIHGTKDASCPYPTAMEFQNALEKARVRFEFHSLEGAGHAIWYDRRFTGQISAWRNDFLRKLGFD